MSSSADVVRNGLVLRCSLPASGELRAIATALAVKLAAQLGVEAQGEDGVADAIEELAKRVQPTPDGDVAFEFHKLDRQLKIEARCGARASSAVIAIPA